MNFRKSQVMLEFTLVIVFVVLLFTLFTAFIRNEIRDYSIEREESELNNFGRNLQQKFFIASNMHEGFSFEVKVPERINKKYFSLYILSSNLYVEQGELQLIYSLPKTNGDITSDIFYLSNVAGEVLIS